ncbi:phosphoribosylformylglycinamidine synthase I [Candidatus Peregrinibacteria bacterium]|nr:MAG: phosphoribosylformylglycinamidine synthase I [Candidatus Peregrinibacteria bacterium]
MKFAVISFPGTNCEEENVRAFKRNGMDAEMVLWNDPKMLDGSRLSEFDGYCIAGGFSYEDRSRSGVIAAQNPIMDVIKKEAEAGKVVLGICNGAQVLVETGMIPGFDNYDVAVSLAANEMVQNGRVVKTGYYCNWAYLKNVAPKGRCAFNNFDELIHVPFAHGEGRFIFKDPAVLEQLKQNDQIVFQYSNEAGAVHAEYPFTPNGATEAIAALCNPAGNVMAIMPHPERDPRGNGNQIFQSIKKWIENRTRAEYKPLGTHETRDDIRQLPQADLEFLIRLIIVDNAERTVEMTFKRKGFDAKLKRYQYWAINLKSNDDKKAAAEAIIESGELANLNKEIVYVRIDGQMYEYEKGVGLKPSDFKSTHHVVAADQKDFLGDYKKNTLNVYLNGRIETMKPGVFWEVEGADDALIDQMIESKIWYNPNAMYLLK